MSSNDISFDDMFSLLLSGAEPPTPEPIIVHTKPVEVPQIVQQAQPAAKRTPKTKTPAPIKCRPDEFDATCNILDNNIKEAFQNDVGYIDNNIFTQPVPTTFTMEGFLSNVKFDEKTFIHMLEPTERIVVLDCNYGKKIHVSYTEPVIIKKNKRGRKKKEKVQSKRKIQGSGKCFNSQVTFVVRADVDTTGKNIVRREGMDPDDDLVYKFKVFRNGRIQLPGAKPISINDILDKVMCVIDMLNAALHPGENDPTKLISIININSVMKNYKFAIKLGENQIIDLVLLKRKMMEYRVAVAAGANDVPKHPPIVDINYTRESTKNAITFATPRPNKPKKVTKLNIFMSGKVNILGAYHSTTALEICNLIHYIFTMYPQLIVEDIITAIEPVDILIEDELKLANNEIMQYINSIPEEGLKVINKYILTILTREQGPLRQG
jgi:hypothetical protein